MYIVLCDNCGRQIHILKHKPKTEKKRFCKTCRGLAHKYYLKGYCKARYKNLREEVEREVLKILKRNGIEIENGKELNFTEMFK